VAVESACRSVAETTARRCEALGHRVEIVSWPYAAEDAVFAQGTIISAHLAATVDARLAQVGRPLAAGDIEDLTAAMCDRGRQVTGVGYVAAIQAMHRIGRAMGALFERIDVLVTPMLGRLPVPIGTLDTSDPARFGREIGTVTPFAGLANLTGQPAMSLPLDEADHLPVGSQVIGRFGDEATLLRLAGQLERAHPWSARRPALVT
jgi:Asp-tRNA(Asn)/Glu-tRNA(Gln) amidotransferase A subunit family amidase